MKQRNLNNKKLKHNENLEHNLFWIKIIFLSSFVLIVAVLFMYSVCGYGGYKALAEDTQYKVFKDPQIKGNFYDRNSNPLTLNKEVCCVYVDKRKKIFTKYAMPKEQCPLTPKTAIGLLAKTINKDANEIYNNVYKQSHSTALVLVAENIDIKYYEPVKDLNYKGIVVEKKIVRKYPEGHRASRVLGVIRKDGTPLEGLELILGKYTQGKEGVYKAQVDKRGRPLLNTREYLKDEKTGLPMERVDGNNVYLTLDSNIQFYAETALNKTVSLYKPKHAMCIVMDPDTSEILAMANYPKFDPENITKYTPGMSANFCVQNMYEPGSTLKSFTVSMAIEKGYDKDYAFGTCTNVIGFGRGTTVKCDHGPHGACTPKNIIAKSCNIGAWYITKKIGYQNLYDCFKSFGIIGTPGNEFSYEQRGRFAKAPDEWVPVEACNYSFGQGVRTSCLAMANGYCVIANGGVYHTPKIIKEVKKFDGTCVRKEAPNTGRRVISEETSKKMREILAGCVNEGTGKPAKLDFCQAAGKTGSAQIYVNNSYRSGAYLASFMGFAPADDPKLVIYTVIDRPNVPAQASAKYATVLTKDILTEVLPYLNMPKTEEITEKEAEELREKQIDFAEGSSENEANTETPEGEATGENSDHPNKTIEIVDANGNPVNTETTEEEYYKPEIKIDKETGYAIDPTTGALVDPTTGELKDSTISDLPN